MSLVLTCAHVVGDDAAGIVVGTWQRRDVELEVVPEWFHPSRDGGADLALLRVRGDLDHPVACFGGAVPERSDRTRGFGSHRVSGRAMPLSRLAPLRARETVYGLATVDHRGRIADLPLVRALGWEPGTRLDIRERGQLVLVSASRHGVFRGGGERSAEPLHREQGLVDIERHHPLWPPSHHPPTPPPEAR